MHVRTPSDMFENTVYGSVTDSGAEVIAHGCNRCGVMGAGVAKAIRNKYPEIFAPYLKACRDNKPLGSIIPVCCRNGKYVVNILTQVRHIDVKRKAEKLKSDFVQRYFTKPMT